MLHGNEVIPHDLMDKDMGLIQLVSIYITGGVDPHPWCFETSNWWPKNLEIHFHMGFTSHILCMEWVSELQNHTKSYNLQTLITQLLQNLMKTWKKAYRIEWNPSIVPKTRVIANASRRLVHGVFWLLLFFLYYTCTCTNLAWLKHRTLALQVLVIHCPEDYPCQGNITRSDVPCQRDKLRSNYSCQRDKSISDRPCQR